MNHTPHKWILDEDGEPVIYQLNKAGTNLFYLNVQGGVVDTGERTSKEQLRAITEFIYTACNAHGELVALLKRARYYLKSDHSIPCTDLINEIDEKLTTIERGA